MILIIFGYMIHFRDFWGVLDAINWDRLRLYTICEILKIWSTCVDLLGNISTCFGVRKGENGPEWAKIGPKIAFFTVSDKFE